MQASHWTLAFLENQKFLDVKLNFVVWTQQISARETDRKQGMPSVSRPELDIRDLKHDDAFNTTWPPVLSVDKCCQVTSLSIERADNHVLLKALSCLRCLMPFITLIMQACNDKSSSYLERFLIVAKITVLREILKYISYGESLPGSVAC